MTYPVVVRPGQRATANALNAGFLIGRSAFEAFRDAAQSISDSTVGTTGNALSWDNVALDLLGGWSAGSATRYTVTIAGRYMLFGEAGFAGVAAGNRRGATWLVNGTLPSGATSVPHANTPANQTLTASGRALPVELDVGDYVELSPFQNSGGALNTATGSLRPHAVITYTGPS